MVGAHYLSVSSPRAFDFWLTTGSFELEVRDDDFSLLLFFQTVLHWHSQEAYKAGIDLLKKGAISPPPHPHLLKKDLISEFYNLARVESMAQRVLSISQYQMNHFLSVLSYLPLFALAGTQTGPFPLARRSFFLPRPSSDTPVCITSKSGVGTHARHITWPGCECFSATFC